jgi:RNA polymerase sigma-70 factor (ECF subfamily)
MSDEAFDRHLSQITTTWTAVFQAHQGTADSAEEARQRLLQRYSAAVYRYLLAALRSPDAADDLFQEFALRLVRGDFRRADPGRGRFRDFLKTSLYHLVVDHQRRGQRQHLPLAPDVPEPADDETPPAEMERTFLAIWRAELMNRTWEALARAEKETGQPLHLVLRLRTDQPELRSAQMAEVLSARLGREVSAEWVRKRLFLARQKFSELLVREVEQSLQDPTAEDLERELADLGLLEYCKGALGDSSTGQPGA